jgi:hypothetical protein
MSFKDSMAADLAVFLNASEFAEPHDIRFDGELYEEVVCILTHIKEEDRSTRMSDHAQGIYLASTSLHCRLADLDGNLPEKGSVISVSDGKFMRDYYVAENRVAEGMAILSLEALDE